MPRRYPTIEAFYLADPRRVASPERDLGLWWRERRGDGRYRAAWIRDTGELYIARLGAPEDGGGAVEIIGVASTRFQLACHLTGWRSVCGEPGSLSWLRDRTGPLAGALEPAQPPDRDEIRRSLGAHPDVAQVGSIRVCSPACCPDSSGLSAQIVIRRNRSCHVVRRELQDMLADRFDLEHTILQIDHESHRANARSLARAQRR